MCLRHDYSGQTIVMIDMNDLREVSYLFQLFFRLQLDHLGLFLPRRKIIYSQCWPPQHESTRETAILICRIYFYLWKKIIKRYNDLF